jgi:glycosyltransferase involved in cell wall biosynthesis
MIDGEYNDLSVVIPAYNEAMAIEGVIKILQSGMPGVEIIVVDDCSRDNTAQLAAALDGVIVLRHIFNRGQGAALKTGMKHSSRTYVAWFDGDNEHRVDDLQKLYARIKEENLAAVIGQRITSSATRVRGVGKALIRFLGHMLGVKAGSDLNCGLRIFNRKVILNYYHIIPDRFSASLMSTLIMLERQYPFKFTPVQTSQRIGASTVRIKDGFGAILQLLRAILLFAPMRFFMPLGALCLGGVQPDFGLIRKNGRSRGWAGVYNYGRHCDHHGSDY